MEQEPSLINSGVLATSPAQFSSLWAIREGLTESDGKEGEAYRAAAFGGGLCVAVGSFGGDNIFATTSDGKTWKTGKQDAKYSKYVRGDNNPEYAKYLGYLDARELYPDFTPVSFKEFLEDVLAGGMKRPYPHRDLEKIRASLNQ